MPSWKYPINEVRICAQWEILLCPLLDWSLGEVTYLIPGYVVPAGAGLGGFQYVGEGTKTTFCRSWRRIGGICISRTGEGEGLLVVNSSVARLFAREVAGKQIFSEGGAR